MRNLWLWVLVTSELLSSKWQNYFAAYERLIVGFSGGLDSTVLLHLLASCSLLHSKITAFHVNHGISPHAAQWQAHCQHFCQNLDLQFIAIKVDFERGANIENAARNARYAAFAQHMSANSCLVLGHHLDDQAETVLLQLFRGAGIDGLAAMTPSSSFTVGGLARPLLTYARQQLEQYATSQQLIWIEDESNEDIHYARNYLRHEVIPLLQKKWPAVVANVANTALHCQEAKANLRDLAMLDCPQLSIPSYVLPISTLTQLSHPRQMNILRAWLQKNDIKLPATKTLRRLIFELIMAAQDATPVVSWGTIRVYRYQQELILQCDTHIKQSTTGIWRHFPEPFNWNNSKLIAQHVSDGGAYIPKHAVIEVRARQGGERLMLHGQTKSLKKLLQQWKIPPWVRDQLPLIYINEMLAIIPGYAISDLFSQSSSASLCWHIVSNAK